MTWLGYSHKGVAKRLNVATQPAGATAGSPFTTQPVIELLDGASLPASSAGVSVAVAKHSGVVGTLSGTSPRVTASNGRATFTDLAMSAAESGVSLDFSASGLTGVTSAAFDVSPGGVALDFFSDWRSGTGSSSTIIRDGGKWSSYEGNGLIDIVTSPAGGPTTNACRTRFGTSNFDWLFALSLWTVPSIGSSIWHRFYFYNDISDAVDFGTGYAATHPIEGNGGSGGLGGNVYSYKMGARPDGTGEFFIEYDAITRQFCMGGAGGADPTRIAKHTWWRVESQFLRTATATYTQHMRVYNQAGTLTYSDADGLDNIYVWGGGKMSANNTGLPVDVVNMEALRMGINGGPTVAGTQYVYYAGVGVSKQTWCGPWTSNG